MATLPPDFDATAFAAELDALRAEIDASLGTDDLDHLRRMERWGRMATTLGYAVAWIAPNPLSAMLLALGSSARWTIVAHHVSHRALDRIPETPERLTSRGFARGWRRFLDWNDWIDPDAWAHEHNRLHHYRTGERGDPDLVEEQMRSIREAKLPRALKYAVVAFFALTWKYTYYAPNTLAVWRRDQQRRAEGRRADPAADATDIPILAQWDPRTPDGRAFWRRCIAPYVASRFVLVPALFAPLGPWAVFSVWCNSMFAEALTQLHTFAIIATNHAGEDIHRFDRPTQDRAEFYLRQVLGTVNFPAGGDAWDFLHGYLNYQIEHHLWPDVPPRKYRQFASRVRAVCERHGVPYLVENVATRVRKTIAIMVGDASMIRSRTTSKAERRAKTA